MTGEARGRFFGGVALVIVLAFALGAVALLISTLLAAEGIDEQVDSIRHSTAAIDEDTDAVRIAARTGELAERIYEEARPLDGELEEVVGSSDRIARRARGIRQSADSIDMRVRSIAGHVVGIHASAGSINATAGSIAGRTVGIRGTLGGVLPTTRSIDAGVARTNRKARAGMQEVRRIQLELARTLAEIGLEAGHPYPQDATILGHAHSVDCQLHRLLRPGQPAPCPR
jgi:methyl-accepting chemotaxis protein